MITQFLSTHVNITIIQKHFVNLKHFYLTLENGNQEQQLMLSSITGEHKLAHYETSDSNRSISLIICL